MDRNPSSISREIKKNRVKGKYHPEKADHKAYVRKHESRYGFKAINENKDLEKYIIQKLKDGLAPEAVSGRMKEDKKPWYASKTAIYDWLYSNRGQRYCYLLLSQRHGRRRRKKKKTKRFLIPEKVSIHQRPKMTILDFEGDTIVSSWNTVSIVSIYNPKTMYLDAKRVLNLKPTIVAKAMKQMFEKIRIRSITLDNGQENRLHKKLGIKTYFCDPYASWQKPGIENGNKLIRRYIPKKSDIAKYSHQFIKLMVDKYNDKPRKKLRWKTPNEIMEKKKLFLIKTKNHPKME